MRSSAKERKACERSDHAKLIRKSSLLKTETTKYNTKASEGTLGFSQPQIDRVPRTRNDQIANGEVQKEVPNTNMRVPRTIGSAKD